MNATLSTLATVGGDNIALYDWQLGHGALPRAVVLLVHGLGEHAGRYAHAAAQLNAWGFAVRGYDQHGHGESGGLRGALPSPTRLLDDLATVVDHTRLAVRRHADSHSQVPLVLLGHSLGGLVAARFVALGLRPVDGLVLSSPAFDAGLSAFQKWLLATLPTIAPNLRVGNGLKTQFISRDPAVVAAYRQDKRVHGRIGVTLARFIADTGPATVADAPEWAVPTLLMFAGADRLVNPAGSAAFAAAASQAVVTPHRFDAMYHELFNEPERAEVFAVLQRWLDARF